VAAPLTPCSILRDETSRAWPPVAQTAAPAGSASASPDLLAAISRGLAAVRQSLDKLAADISKLQAAKQDTPSAESRLIRTGSSVTDAGCPYGAQAHVADAAGPVTGPPTCPPRTATYRS